MPVNILDHEAALQVASMLLDIKAVQLNLAKPFTWASGWKSPIYCDNRIALSYPAVRDYIKEELAKLISHQFANAEAIVGVATAGIPQGVLVAQELGLAFAYVRDKPKAHGMTNQIEGKLDPGQKVVVVEDLISTGGSSLRAVETLKTAGVQIQGMAAIFNYDFAAAKRNFEESAVDLWCLSSYPILIQQALQNGEIKASHTKALEAWRNDPVNWDQ